MNAAMNPDDEAKLLGSCSVRPVWHAWFQNGKKRGIPPMFF